MDSKRNFSKQTSSESDNLQRSSDTGPTFTVDALGRKVWDKNYFTEKAINKSTGGDVVEDTISSLYQGTFKKPVIAVPEVREDLKPRKETIDFSKYVGKTEIIEDVTLKHKQGGFFCKTCNCILKDSQTYLDHLNGRKHNRLLGMTMRVEKVDAKTVAAKLRNMANQDSVAAKTKEELENDARERIKELEMYEKELREKRKLMKKEKKKKKHQPEHVNSESYDVKEEYEYNGVKSEFNVKTEEQDEDKQHLSEYGKEDKVKKESKIKQENDENKDNEKENNLNKEKDNEEEESEYLSPELEAMKASGLPISFV